METFPLAVPKAKIGLCFAQIKQDIASFKPTSTFCFLRRFASHNITCGDWQITAKISPSLSHAKPVHKLKQNREYVYPYEVFVVARPVY